MKPLPSHLAMRCSCLNAAGQSMLAVVLDIKLHAQLGACLAGAAFADNGQWRTDGFLALFNQGLVAHCGSQIFFEAWHIDHPIERVNTLLAGFKIKVATLVAFTVREVVPWQFTAALLAREVLLLASLAVLRRYGYGPPPVHYVGKTATFLLLAAFPVLLLASAATLA